jgi:hypothetical protein
MRSLDACVGEEPQDEGVRQSRAKAMSENSDAGRRLNLGTKPRKSVVHRSFDTQARRLEQPPLASRQQDRFDLEVAREHPLPGPKKYGPAACIRKANQQSTHAHPTIAQ